MDVGGGREEGQGEGGGGEEGEGVGGGEEEVEAGPAQQDPADRLADQNGDPGPAAGGQKGAQQAGEHHQRQGGIHRPVIAVRGRYLGLAVPLPLLFLEGRVCSAGCSSLCWSWPGSWPSCPGSWGSTFRGFPNSEFSSRARRGSTDGGRRRGGRPSWKPPSPRAGGVLD